MERTELTTLEALKNAIKNTPETLKTIFGVVVDFLKFVREENPIRLKNAAKIVHVIRDSRKRLTKSRALGLDKDLSETEYVEKWLGAKVNRRIMALAKAVSLVKESIFDTREIGQLQRLGQIASYTGSTIATALADLKTALVIEKSNERVKAFNAIAERVVADPDGKTHVYLTPAEYAEHQKLTKATESVSAVSELSVEQLEELLAKRKAQSKGTRVASGADLKILKASMENHTLANAA